MTQESLQAAEDSLVMLHVVDDWIRREQERHRKLLDHVESKTDLSPKIRRTMSMGIRRKIRAFSTIHGILLIEITQTERFIKENESPDA